MNRSPLRRPTLFCAALMWALGSAPLAATAASSAASSASDGASASVGSASVSLKASSDGSSRATRTARGDYAITEVASAEGRAGFARLTLTPVEREAVDPRADASADTNAETSAAANAARADALNAGSLHLFVPQGALERHALASGTVVSAQPGPYGVAFARRDTHERFFLVLDDDWHRELASHPVSL